MNADKPVVSKVRPRPLQTEGVKVDSKAAHGHFLRWQSAIEAVVARDVAASNVNIPKAVIIAIGASVNLLASREEIVATVSNFDVASLDGLTSVAHAAWHSDLAHRVASDASLSCADLMPEAEDLRETLLLATRMQVKRGRIPQSVVTEVEPGSGIEDRANDLAVMSHAFRSRWETLKDKVDITEKELDRADELSLKLLGRLAARVVPQRSVAGLTTVEVRARAWTLLLKFYEECRRGAATVWWYEPGGWEQYVPPLRTSQSRTGGRTSASKQGGEGEDKQGGDGKPGDGKQGGSNG